MKTSDQRVIVVEWYDEVFGLIKAPTKNVSKVSNNNVLTR